MDELTFLKSIQEIKPSEKSTYIETRLEDKDIMQDCKNN